MKSELKEVVVKPAFIPKILTLTIETEEEEMVIAELWNFHTQIRDKLKDRSVGTGLQDKISYDCIKNVLSNISKATYEEYYKAGKYRS